MTAKKNPKDLKKRGRKPLITPQILDKLETAFSIGCTDIEACFYAKISESTLYNYQEKHPEFVERKKQLKERLVFQARTVIADSLNHKDESTARWYLERKRREEFSTTVATEVKGEFKIVVADDKARKAIEDL